MNAQQIREFVLAGHALFTIKSLRTQEHYTFKVRGVNPRAEQPPTHWNVAVLNGRDNTKDYKHVGRISNSHTFYGTLESSPAFLAFNWIWTNLNREGERFQFMHCGRCGRCGRLLTTPESVSAGIGPECRDKMDFEAQGGTAGLLNQLFGELS